MEYLVLCSVAIVLGMLSVFPAGIILRKSLLDATGGLSSVNFTRVLADRTLLHAPLWNSLRVSVAVTGIALVMAYPLAMLVARTDMPWRRAIAALTIGPYIIPSYALSMAWVLLFSADGIGQAMTGLEPPASPYGFWPIVVITAMHLFPFAFILLANAMAGLNGELFDAARIHGAGRWHRFFRITLPMLLPAILSSAVVTFSFGMTEFAPAMLLGTPENFYVLTTQIWSYATVYPTNYGVASVLCIVLVSTTFAFLQVNKFLLGGRRHTTIGGNLGQAGLIRLGRWRYAALGYCLVFLCIVLMLPIACIFAGSLVDLWGKGWGISNWTIRHFASLLDDRTYKQSIVNVLYLGVVSGTATVVLGAAIGYFITRGSPAVSRSLEIASYVPFILPGVVIGVALILGFSRPPFDLYGTVWILAVGYVIRFLPLVVSSCKSAFAQIDDQLEEAGRIFGASWISTQRRIVLPLLRSPLLGAAVLVFVSVMKEVGMAALVWSPGAEVAPVMALIQFADGFVQEAVGLSLVMMAIVLIGTLIAVRLGAVKLVEVR